MIFQKKYIDDKFTMPLADFNHKPKIELNRTKPSQSVGFGFRLRF
jgi:hypothetical protein